MKDTQSSIIKALQNHGMKLISTPLQLQRGTLIFNDTKQPEYDYAIYGKSGYVRKRRNPEYSNLVSYWSLCGPRWWQLNKVEIKNIILGGYEISLTKRILTPGDLNGMAETIIRVSTKSRNKVN